MENTGGGLLYGNRDLSGAGQKTGQWLSAKEFHTGKNGGGIGLKSIEQIVANHAGMAEYRLEDGKFISRVILYY